MRRRFGQSLRIGVSPAAITLLAARRFGGVGRTPAAETLAELRLEHSSHPDALAGALRVLLADAGCAGWPATIVLADELVRLWQVTPPAGTARLADLEAAAAVRFQSLYGDSAGAWQLSANWDAARPFLAAGAPRALLASCSRPAPRTRCRWSKSSRSSSPASTSGAARSSRTPGTAMCRKAS